MALARAAGLCFLFSFHPATSISSRLDPPPSPIHARAAAATARHLRRPCSTCTPQTQPLSKCSTFCLIEMGREKRKGNEVVVEKPVRKQTLAEREAERAEMVAKSAEEQASGHARPFAIREQPARGRG